MPELGASFHSLAGAVRCETCRSAMHDAASCLRYDRAPRAVTHAEAAAIAADEYAARGRGMYSRGADGGMHWRGDAYSAGAAEGWRGEQARGFVRKIMAGEARHTIFYDRARDTFYCG